MNDAPIPPDIRKAAEAVVERGYNEGLLDAVCRALMAERVRCAAIATEEAYASLSLYPAGAAEVRGIRQAACDHIAAAIRRGA